MSENEVAHAIAVSEETVNPTAPGPASPRAARHRRRFPRTRLRRGIYALLGIVLVLVIGTVGFHAIAGLGWVDAFYFESMLATGQGPPLTLTSDGSKLFASLMAFVSVGSVISAILLTLGPIIMQLWRETVELVEDEARVLEREVLGKGPRR